MASELDWVRIDCIHSGYIEEADRLIDCRIEDGGWWLFKMMLADAFRPTSVEVICLTIIITLWA